MAVASTARMPLVPEPNAMVWVETSAVMMLIFPPSAVLIRSAARFVIVKLPVPAMVSVFPSGSAAASIVIVTPLLRVMAVSSLPRTIVLMPAA